MIKNRIHEYYDMIEPDKGLKNKMLAKVLDSAPSKSRKRWNPWAAVMPVLAATVLAVILISSNTNHNTTGQYAGVVSAAPTESNGLFTNLANAGVQYVYHTAEEKYAPDFIKSSLDGLESITTAVVKATVFDSKQNPELDSNISITLTTIHINKVLKSDGTIKEEGDYTLVEYYRIQPDPDNSNIINIFSTNGALPLIKNHEYLLFLRKPAQEYGDYSIAGSWQGKFPLTEKTLSNRFKNLTAEDMEFPKGEPLDSLWIISEQAYNKYCN